MVSTLPQTFTGHREHVGPHQSLRMDCPTARSETVSQRKVPIHWSISGVGGIHQTPLANRVLAYAQKELKSGTINHSMIVYYYGDTYTYWRNLQILQDH